MSIWQLATDTVFSRWALLFLVALLLVALVQDAYSAWRDDLPWFGFDLRRMRRWHIED
jgi:hypothetical protein